MEIARRVGLQTARAITLAIALGLDLQEAARFGRKVSSVTPSRISRQITVGFAPQTGPEAGPKIGFGQPFGVALDTTPRTVMGTVRVPVPESPV